MYPTQKRLHELFDYEPKTGILTRKYSNSRRPLGSPVGVHDSTGYLRMRNPGRRASIGVHRIIWVWVHGEIPDGYVIDHINHVRDDNRLCNLRCVTRLQNQRNMRTSISNRTGITGVHYIDGFWRARLNVAGVRNYYLGSFDTKAEALAARRAAEIVLGFHPNHGKRAAPEGAALEAC